MLRYQAVIISSMDKIYTHAIYHAISNAEIDFFVTRQFPVPRSGTF